MRKTDLFQWHPDARLFVGRQQVAHPGTSEQPQAFAHIAASPVSAACATLGQALVDGTPFCVSATAQTATASQGMFLTLTGGTSGPAKVLRRSHASWILGFAVNSEGFRYSARDAIAVLGSLEHSLALFGTIEALHLGLSAHVLAGVRPDDQGDMIRDQSVTILYATPSQLRLLCRSGEPLPDVRLILCGGGLLDRPTRNALAARCPNAHIRIFYGAAETSFVTLSDPDMSEGSVGRAYPGVELLVANDGLIWVRSPYLFEGYAAGDSAHTRWHDGYVTVGEIGRLDANGYLYLKGRVARMVTIADQNVFLEEVEAVIASLPGLPPSAVLARTDPARGSVLVAVIHSPEDTALRSQIQTACRAVLSPLAVPRQIVFTDDFPLLPSGKPDLAALAEKIGAAA